MVLRWYVCESGFGWSVKRAKIVENGRYGALFTRLAPVVVVVWKGVVTLEGQD